jgi:hypothetical protein
VIGQAGIHSLLVTTENAVELLVSEKLAGQWTDENTLFVDF